MSTPLAGTEGLGALTVFVDDLAAEADFCQQVLGLAVIISDDQSVLFTLGSTALNLLAIQHAGELVTPAPTAAVTGAAQVMLTLWVPDVDAVCDQLKQRGSGCSTVPWTAPGVSAPLPSPPLLAWSGRSLRTSKSRAESAWHFSDRTSIDKATKCPSKPSLSRHNREHR